MLNALAATPATEAAVTQAVTFLRETLGSR